jgi:hypothetical protein
VNSSNDDNLLQPAEEDAQGNVLMEEEQALIKINDSRRTPNKEDAKPAAQPENKDRSRRLNRTKEDSVNKNTNLTT